MNTQRLRTLFSASVALVTATMGSGSPPTQQEALAYAKSVVLVRRMVKGNLIRSYVKEVWRFDPHAGAPPPVGSEYGMPLPYDPRRRHLEKDAVVFRFGANRPRELPMGWTVQVSEQGLVVPFLEVSHPVFRPLESVAVSMNVEELKTAVRNTNPKP